MERRLPPSVVQWTRGLNAAWQVVFAGRRGSIRLGAGPCSDHALLVIFEGTRDTPPSVVAVCANAPVASRKGAMPIGDEATARLNALAKMRPGIVFGLPKAEFQKGPFAAFNAAEHLEKHARTEFFAARPLSPAKCLRPDSVVLRHRASLLAHCGIEYVETEGAIVVPTLGPALSICPKAIAAIHRGASDEHSTRRIAKVPGGWRIPYSVVDAGLIARIAKALEPGIRKLRERYDTNADLALPFRANPRRPTTLVECTKLPRCVVEWILRMPPGGLKYDAVLAFAGFANATNRRDEVYDVAIRMCPGIAHQLRKGQRDFTKTTRTCDDIRANPSYYERLGLVCTCAQPQPSAEILSALGVFTPSPGQPETKKQRFF